MGEQNAKNHPFQTRSRNFGIILFLIAALIWGVAFVAQSVGMEHVGPMEFVAYRFLIASVAFLPVVLFRIRMVRGIRISEDIVLGSRELIRHSLISGLKIGIILFVGIALQQIGLQYTTVGKAGFITTLYIIIVPFLGVFFGKKLTGNEISAAVLAVIGMFLLTVNEHLSVNPGDLLMVLCAVGFSFQILAIDRVKNADSIILAAAQYMVVALLALMFTLIFEKPNLHSFLQALLPIAYAAIFSTCLGFTFQIIGQKYVEPNLASMLMSLESVFSVLAGFLILGQNLSVREIIGCVVVFVAIIYAQMRHHFT